MITYNKDEEGKRNVSINLIPRLNFTLLLQLVAVLTSWALHESVIRSFVAFLFGGLYLVAWILFGDSATKEGMDYIIEYYRTSFR